MSSIKRGQTSIYVTLHISEPHIPGQCVFVILGCRSITNCMSVYDYERSYMKLEYESDIYIILVANISSKRLLIGLMLEFFARSQMLHILH